MTILDERDFAHVGDKTGTLRAEDVLASQEFRKFYETLPNVVTAEEMPFERSADGLIKHLVHHKMNTRERCVEAYMQFLEPGERSGKHRHMWEEVLFVVEGSKATTCTGISNSIASTRSNGSGRRNRRDSNGSAATSSTCRPSPSTSTSTIMPHPRRG
jgi:hypothetical protein